MLCKRCVLPERKPDIWLNSEGLCNICVEFETNKSRMQNQAYLESDLVKRINLYKGKGKYDCLVMCSGGKDSVASLYYMKKRYRMNPLVLTFDHGLENEEALANVRNAVNILGVDWVYFKTDFMKEVFRLIVESRTQAPICHVCALWYIKFTNEFAARYNIHLIVAGWTMGQAQLEGEPPTEYGSMSKNTADFVLRYLRSNPKYKDFPRNMREAIIAGRKTFKTEIISPHWYLALEYDKVIEILKNELKWRPITLSYPRNSTNCLMNFVNVYLNMKNYGYTHYHIEMSRMIREGGLTRAEALNMLEINFDDKLVVEILDKINCKFTP